MPRHEPQHLPQAIADLNAAFAVLCKGDAFIFFWRIMMVQWKPNTCAPFIQCVSFLQQISAPAKAMIPIIINTEM